MAGLKNTLVASTAWSRVKKELRKVAPVVDPAEDGKPAEPSKGAEGDGEAAGKKRKRGAGKNGLAGSGDEAKPSKKRARAAGKGAKKAVKLHDNDATPEPNDKEVSAKKTLESEKSDEDVTPLAAKADKDKDKKPASSGTGLTPVDDRNATPFLGCITVQGSDGEDAPVSKKSGTPKKGKGAKRGKTAAEDGGAGDKSDKPDKVDKPNVKPKSPAAKKKAPTTPKKQGRKPKVASVTDDSGFTTMAFTPVNKPNADADEI